MQYPITHFHMYYHTDRPIPVLFFSESVVCVCMFCLFTPPGLIFYFRKVKHRGIVCLINSALFEKSIFLKNIYFLFLIGIHPMQCLTATMKHGVSIRKRSTKRLKHSYRKSVQKKPKVKWYLLILDFRSQVKVGLSPSKKKLFYLHH